MDLGPRSLISAQNQKPENSSDSPQCTLSSFDNYAYCHHQKWYPIPCWILRWAWRTGSGVLIRAGRRHVLHISWRWSQIHFHLEWSNGQKKVKLLPAQFCLSLIASHCRVSSDATFHVSELFPEKEWAARIVLIVRSNFTPASNSSSPPNS